MKRTTDFLVFAVILSLVGLFFSGCATIDRKHVDMASRLRTGVDREETQTMAALDALEDSARRELELKMFYIIGRAVVEKFVAMKDSNGLTFDKKVCRAKGIGRAEEILKFTLALSRFYERRKKQEWAPIEKEIQNARRETREEFDVQRRGLSALESGLRAYTKDKQWREDMLRSVGVPVANQKAALATATKKVEALMEKADE